MQISGLRSIRISVQVQRRLTGTAARNLTYREDTARSSSFTTRSTTYLELATTVEGVSNGGRVQEVSGKLIFSDETELARYNAIVDSLRALVVRERSAEEKIVAARQEPVDRLRLNLR